MTNSMARQEDRFIARCARAMALAKLDNHNEAEQWLATGEILTATVVSSTEDLGITIDLDPPVLIPARQLLAATPYMRDPQQLIKVLQALVGTSISVQAIKVDLLGNHRKPTDHIVLSERGNLRASGIPDKIPSVRKLAKRDALGRTKRQAKRQAANSALIAKLDVGQICQGVVSSVTSFGAFIDLGEGATGLIHKSELSSSNVDHVEDVLQVGDEIQVYVLTLDREKNRIGLSLRRLDSVSTSEHG